MSSRRRKEGQPNLEEAIRQTAWRQIARVGAPALSLRGIARELGITAPAIYNCYPLRGLGVGLSQLHPGGRRPCRLEAGCPRWRWLLLPLALLAFWSPPAFEGKERR